MSLVWQAHYTNYWSMQYLKVKYLLKACLTASLKSMMRLFFFKNKDLILKKILVKEVSRKCLGYKNLKSNELVYFPVEIVGGFSAMDIIKDHGDTLNNKRYLYYLTTNGSGAGASKIEANIHAIQELIERDAVSSFLLDVAGKKPTGLKVLIPQGSYLNKILYSKKHLGDIDIRLIDSVVGYAAIAFSAVEDVRGREQFGVGASMNESYSIERAILELEQEILASDEEDESCKAAINLNSSYQAMFTCKNIPMPIGAKFVGDEGICKNKGSGLIIKMKNLVSSLCEKGVGVYSTTLFEESDKDVNSISPTVVHVYISGLERLQIIRDGFSVEPSGRPGNLKNSRMLRGFGNE